MPKGLHPSLLFQNGEVKDFLTALNANVAQERWEFDQFRELCRENPKPRDAIKIDEAQENLNHIRIMTEKARTIYTGVVRNAHKEAASQMRATGDPLLRRLADALESGNYDSLAI